MRAPPMAQLCTALFMGTNSGRAARISAVGASNSGVTSANHRGWLAGMLIFCRSRGLVLLHCTAVAGDCHARLRAGHDVVYFFILLLLLLHFLAVQR